MTGKMPVLREKGTEEVGGWGDGEMGKIIQIPLVLPHLPTSPPPYLFCLLPYKN